MVKKYIVLVFMLSFLMASCQSNEINKNIPPTGTNNKLIVENEIDNKVEPTAEDGPERNTGL